MDSAEIRRRFLNYFAAHDHAVVESAPLPIDDATLLFVNAGMVPFKPYFLGEESAPWKRATSVQKCIRTLDIDEVGKTTRHASFFQMCGNFSFGDYFKEQAIPYAWELLTTSVGDGGYGLDPDRLWATVYHDDDESERIWRETTGIPAERIQRRGMADNFWSMGVPGPCGPCSEIYYDRGDSYGQPGGPIVDEDRYLEVWNLVFMQSERGPGSGKDDFPIIGDLPARNIDTGAGLERLAAILQGVDNIYEIDTTREVLDTATGLTGKAYGGDDRDDIDLRVVADHSRTCVFLIHDGVTPGNEGRGYVLRRLLRRVVSKMHALGSREPVMSILGSSVIAAMSPQYPDLLTDQDRIVGVAEAEEASFLRTLKGGNRLLRSVISEARQAGQTSVSGEQAFVLHDRHGFPIDLTLEIAQDAGLTVDQAGFTELMRAQKERARADAAQKKAGLADTGALRSVLDSFGATDWVAYETLTAESRVLAILRDGEPVAALREGEVGVVVLDRTPFYAESGGQHADAGHITSATATCEVVDVQRPVKALVAHTVRVETGELVVDDHVHAEVDADWRRDARQAHSGTHVVHAALREVLGPNALQAGSFNRPGYLRLDFGWGQGLTGENRRDIEDVSNRAIRDDLAVRVDYMSLAKAREQGALALFGETYGETVRVVEIGGPWSRELCGGTHVERSSQIGPVAVTAESSIGSGLRRIEAVVGFDAFGYLARERDLVSQLSGMLNVKPEELPARVEALVRRLKSAEQHMQKIEAARAAGELERLMRNPELVASVGVHCVEAPTGTSTKELREFLTRWRDEGSDPQVAVVASTDGTKVAVMVAVNRQAEAQGYQAGRLIGPILAPLGGRGGGKAGMAQGGGTEPGRIPEAFAAARSAVAAADR